MDSSDPQGLVGTLLKGKWKIEKVIGVGGTATVFLAVHRNQKKVAVKMLHQEFAAYPDVRDRFLREGYVANTLETDGVVEIIDDDVTDTGQAFLVMEVLDGETVESRWERNGNKMPPLEALKWMEATLEVLHRAHQKGIVHRDIKPENLFITREEKLKVLDFGIARIFQGADVQKATRQGYVMGTPAFMAPEQALGNWDEVDARTDIWAVGASLFTLLTGRYVHNGRTPNEQLMKSATEQAPKLATADPYLPRQLGELVDRSLAFKRESRFADAAAFRDAMVACRLSLEGAAGKSTASIVRSSKDSLAPKAPSFEEERPSAALPVEEGSPDDRLAIANMSRNRLLAEAASIEEKQEATRAKLAAIKEKRRVIDEARKALRAAPPKSVAAGRALPAEVAAGRAVLEADSAHPQWSEVEALGELWEGTLRDVRTLELAERSYDRAKFQMGWVIVLAAAMGLIGFIAMLAAKPGPAMETLELQERH